MPEDPAIDGFSQSFSLENYSSSSVKKADLVVSYPCSNKPIVTAKRLVAQRCFYRPALLSSVSRGRARGRLPGPVAPAHPVGPKNSKEITRMKRIQLWLCLALSLAIAAGDGTTLFASQYFTIEKVAEGVYAAIGKPGVFSNGAFIVTEDGVVVVDTHLRPSWARDLISEIKKTTPQPIRYVINTHWHNDHTQGGQAYVESFPKNVEFISQHSTRDDILHLAIPSVKQSLEKDVPEAIQRLQGILNSGKAPDGSALTDERRAQVEAQLDSQKGYLEELKTMTIVVPNMTFERSLILHKYDKEVRILYLGLGHTRGDIVVFLPKEKVLISGDLLTGGPPFMRDAYPSKWATTLEQVGRLDFTKVIPGHGPVEDGKDHLQTETRYISDLVSAVAEQVKKGASLEDTQKAVVDLLVPKYEKEYGATLKNAVPGNVERTYHEAKGEIKE
jgi:glyoxylase-like metal-dependent hydrolase (beta-lactamase superfamily II)